MGQRAERGGQVLTVSVTNTSAATTTKWAVAWALGAGRRIVSAWNAAVSTSGGTATAINASHNGILAPGTSATFGMQLSGVGPAPALSCDNGATTPTSSPPPSGTDVTVTEADNRGTVRLRVGGALVVSLASNYLPPTLSTSRRTRAARQRRRLPDRPAARGPLRRRGGGHGRGVHADRHRVQPPADALSVAVGPVVGHRHRHELSEASSMYRLSVPAFVST
nr:hypothetical protein GCM10020092_034100 [Actinoplanes digitatis]